MSLTDHHSALADALAATRPPRSIGPRTAASLARGTRTYERRRARSECPRQCRSSSDLPLGSSRCQELCKCFQASGWLGGILLW